MIRRAENAGYKALVITVDGQYLGRREADYRNHFTLPAPLVPANLQLLIPDEKNHIFAGKQDLFLKNISLKHIEWLQSQTELLTFY